MLFAIAIEAMNGTEEVLYALDAIVGRSEDGVHEVDIRDADQLEESVWYQTSRPDRRKFLEERAAVSLRCSPRTRGPHLRRIDVQDANSAAFAQSSAYEPLRVLLENDQSDAELVEAALRMFGNTVAIELCFGPPSQLEPPAFQMESRGGVGELRKLVKRYIDKAKDRRRAPRIIAVTDSDGEWPGDVKPHAQVIRDDCHEAGVPCPPLTKRTAENYIPDAVWRAWAAAREGMPAVEALLRLSPEQRDHVHLAKSNSGPWDGEKPEVAALFARVGEADRELLRTTDLKGKRHKMLIFALRDHRDVLTPENLGARDGNGDLLAIVRTIEEEL